MQPPYPPGYLEGIRLFNVGEFFECHDVLEEVWTDTLGEEREFYQGLIQAAVALFHFESGNLGGARKLCLSSRRYLKPYGSAYGGIDLEAFRADFDRCFEPLLEIAPGSAYPSHLQLDAEKVPQIALSAEAHDP